ncbi:MAG: type II toxin-antitoxin system RelB/DinJ family antitoxin [Cellulosilyticum sp.]|nr:type II toxin-antitoxin system RelB/DinJ family antitoxin [Cellulosilyticum sp.]
MAQTTLSVRIDENVKKQFDAFCNAVGMNTSVAINLFVKTVIRENKIPFEIGLGNDPFYSEENQMRLINSINRLESGLGSVHELIEVDDD